MTRIYVPKFDTCSDEIPIIQDSENGKQHWHLSWRGQVASYYNDLYEVPKSIVFAHLH